MATMWLRTLLILVPIVASVYGENPQFTPIRSVFPGVIFFAEKNGSFTLESQIKGNISFFTSLNHSIFYKDIDLLKIIELVNATPPYWEDYGTYGYLGVFRGLQKVSTFVKAKDPEMRPLQYQIVAGDLPVGISLNPLTGELKGIAPDIDATFIFTVRATNGLGSFADAIFRIVLKNSHVCLHSPCQNEGTCVETRGTFRCDCLHPFGGPLCKKNCTNNPLGVGQSLKTVHDAEMTAFGTLDKYFGYNARIGNSAGWYGTKDGSWVQIDLGNQTDIHGVQMQGRDSKYYTEKFYLQYSLDGKYFENYTSPFTGMTEMLTGYRSASVYTNHLPGNLLTRFVRLLPATWNRSYQPFMRVELLGCHMY